MRSPVRSIFVYLLPLTHLCICLTIGLGGIGSGWEYMTMVDAPASVLVIGLLYDWNHPLILFGVIGSLWWYLLSLAIGVCWVRLSGAIRNRRASRREARNV